MRTESLGEAVTTSRKGKNGRGINSDNCSGGNENNNGNNKHSAVCGAHHHSSPGPSLARTSVVTFCGDTCPNSAVSSSADVSVQKVTIYIYIYVYKLSRGENGRSSV